MLRLRLGQNKIAGRFVPGELAYADGKVFVCVTVNSSSPHAFRCLFSQEKDGQWRSKFGRLDRFGFNKKLSVVLLEPQDLEG